jgi:two-component system response regulator FixJ
LIQSAGFLVRTFASPGALLRSDIPRSDGCLLVDINLPEMNGIELCDALVASGRGLPTIFMTGYTDDPRIDRLIRGATAIAILYKPFAAALLFEAIAVAFSEPSDKPS